MDVHGLTVPIPITESDPYTAIVERRKRIARLRAPSGDPASADESTQRRLELGVALDYDSFLPLRRLVTAWTASLDRCINDLPDNLIRLDDLARGDSLGRRAPTGRAAAGLISSCLVFEAIELAYRTRWSRNRDGVGLVGGLSQP